MLKARLDHRQRVLVCVRATLSPRLAAAVVSAGIDQGRLTVGIVGATWAARLRYSTAVLRAHVGAVTGISIQSVRIKVVPPPP